MSSYDAQIFQNEYLGPGGTDVEAIITIASHPDRALSESATRPGTAIVVVLDVSGSMAHPRSKIRAARAATIAAINNFVDGVRFAIVAGSDRARAVYPEVGLAVANTATREAAIKAVQGLRARGNTSMSSWLQTTRELLGSTEGGIRHAILLTDGANGHYDRAALASELTNSRGMFRCDCRGIGTNWRVDELRTIATTLLGTVGLVADPSDLAADFEAIAEQAIARHSADVVLRIAVPPGTSRRLVKQVTPTIDDLGDHGELVDDHTIDYPLGAWGVEERDYHVGLGVTAQQVADVMLAARVSVIADGKLVCRAQIRATWTDDQALPTMIDPKVAHYTGQQDLAAAIAAGLAARVVGDEIGASTHFTQAIELATASGHDDTMRLLTRVVDIDPSGVARLKPVVAAADEMALDVGSTRTIRLR